MAKYLAWDPEGGWRITTAADIAKDYEHSFYSGFGRPTKIYALNDERGTFSIMQVTFLSTREDDQDYEYSTYRIGHGSAAEQFTVKIDGRA
jgi:hypothetical protein